jgi:Family of unknown function (DUF5681)
MSGDIGPGRPPTATRFRKGQSGNPKGRPKAGSRVSPSAFDVVIDLMLTVTQNGKPREVTVEEALQHRTYEKAIAGSRTAQREVLKMILKREKWLAANAPSYPPLPIRSEEDPDNADEAMLLLGIAEVDRRWSNLPKAGRDLLLCPWAVQRALSRGRRRLTTKDVSEIKRCTRDAEILRWPAGAKHERDE